MNSHVVLHADKFSESPVLHKISKLGLFILDNVNPSVKNGITTGCIDSYRLGVSCEQGIGLVPTLDPAKLYFRKLFPETKRLSF